MAETYGFYDTEELVDGTYDREYIAQQWADYFKLFIGTGVFASPTNQLKVVAGEGMNIIVKEGWAFIEGRWYHNDADLVLPVQPNTTVSTITSGVFIQADSANREIKAVIATGRTTPDRESPYYELELAQIQIDTGTTAITDAMITDMRTDETVCGFVKGLLEGVIPTADLFLQYQNMFMTWFDSMKDQLSEDAAGHLQLEIDDCESMITENVETSTTSENAYGVDDIFRLDGELFRATDAIAIGDTIEENTNVEKTTVGGLLTYLKSSFSSALTSLKNTAIAQAVGATGSTFTSVIAKLAEIVNRGAWSANMTSTGSVTIPEGYHDGTGTVTTSGTANITSNANGINIAQYSSVNVNVRSAKLIGTYSADTTINVSAYGATSAGQFVLVPSRASGAVQHNYYGADTISDTYWTLQSMSLSGNNLTIYLPKMRLVCKYGNNGAVVYDNTTAISCHLLFIGTLT